ncbi:MAG TPA: transglutaminase-like cysteine peptidase [Sphingobium sp.]|uniref:transglutaminase-like cysteine peptidase n=1 Tax=Sphingobium sp. TaxID=1912891 RepID=UPI002ED018BC
MASARILTFLVSAALFASAAQGQNPGLPFMSAGEFADAPEGFRAMCLRDRALCALGGTEEMEVSQLTPTTMATPTGATATDTADRQITQAMVTGARAYFYQPLAPTYVPVAASRALQEEELAAAIKRVNTQVNRAVIQRSDQDALGVGEYWMRLGPSAHPVGDCEDIAIEKRVRLTEEGFPADRLFYGVAYVRTMGLHTVLIARLADGDYVLDSLTPHIVRWSAVSYTWLRQQMPGKPLEWRRVDGGAVQPNYVIAEAPARPLPDNGPGA